MTLRQGMWVEDLAFDPAAWHEEVRPRSRELPSGRPPALQPQRPDQTGTQPRVYFTHLGGEGTTEQMAKGVKVAFAKQEEIRSAQPQPAKIFGSVFAPGKNAITGATIDAALGAKGQANNGMFKVVIGREVKMPCGCAMT